MKIKNKNLRLTNLPAHVCPCVCPGRRWEQMSYEGDTAPLTERTPRGQGFITRTPRWQRSITSLISR